jgi:hypothetical protein
LNLADCQPARVQRDDLVVEAREAPLVFAYQLRLERPLAIARDLNRDRPLVGEDGLPAGTIAMIAGELGFCRSGWVAEVVGQLAAQRPLNQRLLEPSRRGLDLFGGERTVTDNLIKDFSSDGRQHLDRRLLGLALIRSRGQVS